MAPKAFLKQYRGRIMTVAFSIAMIALGVIWYANRTCQHAAEGRIFRSVGGVPKNEVALVLGTPRKTPRGTPNLHFTQRIEAAVELYRSGKVKHLLVSGDNHVKGYDEPSDMCEALMVAGVPTNAITCDYAGFRTLDSVVRAKTVFGLSRCTIVTEEFHCPRALWIASKHGVEAIAFAAPDLKAARWSLRVKAREILARCWCGVDLYLLHRRPKFPGPREPIRLSANP